MTLLYYVKTCEQLAPYVSRILLQPASVNYLVYKAGQYLEVLHADSSVSPLSIASAPNVMHSLELHLSHHPKNVQALDIMQQVLLHKTLQIRGPYGCCTLDCLLDERPIIFLARGTGFSSIKALLEELLVLKDQRAIHLYWDVATENRWYLQDFIRRCENEMRQFRFTPVLSKGDTQVGLLFEAVVKDYPDLSGYQVYASGSANMVFTVRDYLQQFGLTKEFFYSDMLGFGI